LLVNDEEFLIYVYSKQLENKFSVFTAQNGLEAVQIVCAHPTNYFAAVLLDINMPIMDGFEACKHIYNYLNTPSGNLVTLQKRKSWKKRPSRTLLYALTADVSPETL
jgi:CheY-like chemotaxis protein